MPDRTDELLQLLQTAGAADRRSPPRRSTASPPSSASPSPISPRLSGGCKTTGCYPSGGVASCG